MEATVVERKYDGIRLLAFKNGDDVRLLSRNQLPQQLPALARAVSALPVHDIVLDGEATWDGTGEYHVFDILWVNGRNVTREPLEARRSLLAELPFSATMQRVPLLDDADPFARACREDGRGDRQTPRSVYEHRRRPMAKMKCEIKAQFIVGGVTDLRGPLGPGALILASAGGELVFAGRLARGRHGPPANCANGLTCWNCESSPQVGRHADCARLGTSDTVEVGFIEWTVNGKLQGTEDTGVVAENAQVRLPTPLPNPNRRSRSSATASRLRRVEVGHGRQIASAIH